MRSDRADRRDRPEIWQWRALWLPVSLGIILVQPMVWTGAVTSLFAAGRGLALAVTLCGSSLASFMVPKLTEADRRIRLAHGLVGLGAIWLIIALPIVLLFFTSARDRVRTAPVSEAITDAPPRPSVWQSGVLTRQFFQLLVAGVSIALVVVTMVTSVVPVLSAKGIDRTDAATLAGLVGITAIFGRLSVGALLDRMDGRIIAAVCVSLPLLGLLILLEMPGSIVGGGNCDPDLRALARRRTRYRRLSHLALFRAREFRFPVRHDRRLPWPGDRQWAGYPQRDLRCHRFLRPRPLGGDAALRDLRPVFLLLGPYPPETR